VRLGYAE
jgi:hypothetical protein